MESIYIHLEHCYGIPSLNCTFRFDKKDEKAHLIYAPNGTMKSSFAHTLSDICTDPPGESKDRYFPERPYKRIVKHDNFQGADLTKEEILVIESYSSSIKREKMSLLLANKDLKDAYDRIMRELEATMGRLLSTLINLSGKKSAREIFVSDFKIEESDLYACLCKLYDKYATQELADYSGIIYGHLFTADSEKILTKPEVIKRIDEYFQEYIALLTTSSVFTEKFSHTSARATLNVLCKEGFFSARHKVVLRDTSEGLTEDQFKERIDAEKERIIKSELSEEFDRLDKELGQKSGDIAFRNYLFDHQELIPELHDVTELKKRLWLYYLFANRDLFQEAVLCYRRNEKELTDIIAKAKSQESEWHDIIQEFNNRFIDMPFKLEVGNIDDVILKQSVPIINFMFKSGSESANVEESELLKRLSEGERKALYLLNVLFEIKVRTKEKRRLLIVFDDIADSFDYKNKYAIIEYLIDIIEGEYFLPIILTHNFDFYRTLACRAGIKKTAHFIVPKQNEIEIKQGEYFEDVFEFWKEHVYKTKEIFISSIALARNLVQYKYGQQSAYYRTLTNLLHYKKKTSGDIKCTENILLMDVFGVFSEVLDSVFEKFTYNPMKSAFEFIMETADTLTSLSDPCKLENKVLLAIAIRLKTDKYMIQRINNDAITDAISGNQTRILRQITPFSKEDPADTRREEIIDRVLIVSSENIHLNSFMYEPIIDLSLDELIKLYADVSRELEWKG